MSPGWAKPNAHCSAFLASPLAPAPGCGSRTFHQASFLLFSFVLLSGLSLSSANHLHGAGFCGLCGDQVSSAPTRALGAEGEGHGPTPAISRPEDLGNSCSSLQWCLLARGSEESWVLFPEVLWVWPAKALLIPEPLSGLGFSYLKRRI